jgi:hypothetical protein
MKDDERIALIRTAETNEQLDKATEDYLGETIKTYPALQRNKSFNANMQARHYSHALADIRRARLTTGEWFYDVIRVLECAGDKQLKLKEL